jgi:hypothetical protein
MKGLNWVAIGMGVAVCVAAWILVVVLGMMLPAASALSAMSAQVWMNRAISFASRLAGGFLAGWMSGERGAVHGAIVGVLSALIGNAMGIGLTVARSGAAALSYLSATYWLTVAMWSLVGIGLATVAGHLGASPHFRAGHAAGD